MSSHTKIPLMKLGNKEDLSLNESCISNHFSQQSFLDPVAHEALLKSFELEYEIEDKTGDKILLMNFSKKKKLSVDTSCNKTKTIIFDEPKKTIPTPTAMSSKLELFSYEGDEEAKVSRKSFAVLKPENNLNEINYINKPLNENKGFTRTCPNMKNLAELFSDKLSFLKPEAIEFDEEDGEQTYHSKRTEIERTEWEGGKNHIRNSSWDSFVNLYAKRREMQSQIWKEKNFKKKPDCNNNNFYKINRSKECCFSFAPPLQKDELYESESITNEQFEQQPVELKIEKSPIEEKKIYIHIPGYLKDEIQEQNFTPAQISLSNEEENYRNDDIRNKNYWMHLLYTPQNEIIDKNILWEKIDSNKSENCEKNESMNDKKSILQELYSTQNNPKKRNSRKSSITSIQSLKKINENKENMKKIQFSNPKTSKTKIINNNKNIETDSFNKIEKKQNSSIRKYQLKMNFFEAAREANSEIEKQLKSKCL